MPRSFSGLFGLVLALAVVLGADVGKVATMIDFRRGDELWPSINDGVMGGVSRGEMVRSSSGFASFRGTVSFDNNGGFASVRSRPEAHDLSGFDALRLRVRGDGKRYGFRLRTATSLDGVSYQVSISPPAGEWVELVLPLADFEPVYRGRVVPDHPPLDPSKIRTFGLLISRQEGPFRLDVDQVSAVATKPVGKS
ncbi:MAG: CIA30 family protein [Thermoanaerobaculales bacterium]|jgi:monofunctional biosynthetic peptidoglycan transglycosylase|nr:CIA30 family protein [Thermoanaerobaculales bacterium]